MGLTFSAHEQWPKYEDMVWILIKILKSSPLIKWFKDYPGNLYATIKTSGGEVILQKTQNYWRMEFPTAYVQRSKYNKLIYELVRRSNKELKIHFDILLDLMSENFDLNRIIQREAPQRPMPRPPPPRQRPPTPPRPRPPRPPTPPRPRAPPPRPRPPPPTEEAPPRFCFQTEEGEEFCFDTEEEKRATWKKYNKKRQKDACCKIAKCEGNWKKCYRNNQLRGDYRHPDRGGSTEMNQKLTGCNDIFGENESC